MKTYTKTYTSKTVSGLLGLGTAGLIAHNAFVYHDIGPDNHYFEYLAFLGNDDPIVGTLILLASVSMLYSAWLEYYHQNVNNVVSTKELEHKFSKRPSFFTGAAVGSLLALAAYGLIVGGLSSYDVDMKGWVSTDMGLNPEHNPTDWHKSLYFIGYGLLALGVVFGPTVYGKVSKLATDWWDSLDDEDENDARKSLDNANRKSNKKATPYDLKNDE